MKNGTNPINKLTIAVSANPRTKNIRALLRSLTVPIKNLLNPYAMETAESAKPSSAFVKPCSCNAGIANEKFLRNK